MLDINLFSSYIQKQKQDKILFKYIFISLVIIIFIGILYTIWYHNKINKLENNIEKINSSLSSNDTKLRLIEIDRKRKKLNSLDKYYNLVSDVDNQMENINKINTNIIYSINSSIPNSIYFNSMNISNNIVEIQGISNDKISLAQFQERLNEKAEFSNIYINSIIKNTPINNYTFILTLKIEGDNNDIK
ncbi:PilN domain-containing protein [Clostridium sp. D2Q-14]|uniref:PilN domain-containing protein n=1 Tax=Anaeromonas gelatinilytica TaxID=2683194 RepID=UPI00193C6AB8|nr:PilN domain-containing protein [Anaeromonas gelatinilytica]